jgi:hypothetical protein
MSAGNNAPVNVSYFSTLPGYNNSSPLAYNGPWLSQGDPSAAPSSAWDAPALQYQALNDLMGNGSYLTPDQAAAVAAPIDAFLPLPGLKAPVTCSTAAATFASKTAAKDALRQMGLSDAQLQASLRAVGKATSTSKITIAQNGENILISTTRPGVYGYQQFQYTIGSNGAKKVVQTAYDQFGNLVHYDPKTH